MCGVKKNEFLPAVSNSHTTTIKKLHHKVCGQRECWPVIGLTEAVSFHLLSGYIEKIGKLSLETIETYYKVLELLCMPCRWYLEYHKSTASFFDNINTYVNSLRLEKGLRVRYFEHMKILHDELSLWKKKLVDQSVTYSEIRIYSEKIASISKVAVAMGVPEIAVIEVHKVRELYHEQFENLNKLLLHYNQSGIW